MDQNNKKRQSDPCTVAVIGGGFTGSVLTAQLLRGAENSVSVVLIEPRPSLGRGVAYATPCADHLLNVPAENMSALANDPLHFLHWAQGHFDNSVKAPISFQEGFTGHMWSRCCEKKSEPIRANSNGSTTRPVP